jgi:uncharacterized membrane protein
MVGSATLTGGGAASSIRREVHQPRQIYASAADRRTGRRWSRRHRPVWIPVTLVTVLALAAGEVLRSLM